VGGERQIKDEKERKELRKEKSSCSEQEVRGEEINKNIKIIKRLPLYGEYIYI
jgi:hypothetical protein